MNRLGQIYCVERKTGVIVGMDALEQLLQELNTPGRPVIIKNGSQLQINPAIAQGGKVQIGPLPVAAAAVPLAAAPLAAAPQAAAPLPAAPLAAAQIPPSSGMVRVAAALQARRQQAAAAPQAATAAPQPVAAALQPVAAAPQAAAAAPQPVAAAAVLQPAVATAVPLPAAATTAPQLVAAAPQLAAAAAVPQPAAPTAVPLSAAATTAPQPISGTSIDEGKVRRILGILEDDERYRQMNNLSQGELAYYTSENPRNFQDYTVWKQAAAAPQAAVGAAGVGPLGQAPVPQPGAAAAPAAAAAAAAAPAPRKQRLQQTPQQLAPAPQPAASGLFSFLRWGQASPPSQLPAAVVPQAKPLPAEEMRRQRQEDLMIEKAEEKYRIAITTAANYAKQFGASWQGTIDAEAIANDYKRELEILEANTLDERRERVAKIQAAPIKRGWFSGGRKTGRKRRLTRHRRSRRR